MLWTECESVKVLLKGYILTVHIIYFLRTELINPFSSLPFVLSMTLTEWCWCVVRFI